MPTPYHFAYISYLVYKRAKKPMPHTAWECVFESESNDYGYYGLAFRNEQTKEIIIGHCGTDAAVIQNFRADLQLALGKEPIAYQNARVFSGLVRKLHGEDYTYYETGHSLGAIYAELNAIFFRNDSKDSIAVTFDSPGSKSLFKSNDFTDLRRVKITNYLSAPNFINTSGEHVGKMIRIYVPHIDTRGFTTEDLSKYYNYLSIFGKAYFEVFKALSLDVFTYIQRIHSIKNIKEAFDPSIGEPYIQSSIKSWPSLSDLIQSQLWKYLTPQGKFHLYKDGVIPWLGEAVGSLFYQGKGRVVDKNIRLEENISKCVRNYNKPNIDSFIIPADQSFRNTSSVAKRLYFNKAYQEFCFYHSGMMCDEFLVKIESITPGIIEMPVSLENLSGTSRGVNVNSC